MNNITKRLAVHTADFAVLFVKMHNYHWHVEGLHFKAMHEIIEAYYEEMGEAYDAVAERMIQLGEKAPASMKEYLEITGIKEEYGKAFKPNQCLPNILHDFEYMAKELQITRTEAGDTNDSTTDAVLAEIIEYLEKEIWILKSTLQG